MTHPYYPGGNPRLNHVAMSVPADQLDAANRGDLVRYFHDVFGFDELDMMTVDRHRLIFSCVHWDQFIFLIAEDDPMRCPRMDHFGFSVSSRAELDAAWETGRGVPRQRRAASTSSTPQWMTKAWSRSTRSTWATCCR